MTFYDYEFNLYLSLSCIGVSVAARIYILAYLVLVVYNHIVLDRKVILHTLIALVNCHLVDLPADNTCTCNTQPSPTVQYMYRGQQCLRCLLFGKRYMCIYDFSNFAKVLALIIRTVTRSFSIE